MQNMDNINQYNYSDFRTGLFFPLVEMKYKGTSTNIKSAIIPENMYPLPLNRVGVDEVFLTADDRIVNNIIAGRYMISNYGRIFDRLKGDFMNPVINRPVTGYYKVKFSYYKSYNEIAAKDVYIHRAVLLMFNYIPGAEYNESGFQVNHLNGDHSDNRLCNLGWITPYENNTQTTLTESRDIQQDRQLIDHNLAITDPRQPIRVICSLLQDGFSNKEISERLGISLYTVNDIRQGKIYRSFSKEYNIPKISRSKMQDEIVIKICEYLEHGYRPAAIARMLGVNRQMVAEIKSRRNYTYISSNYIW
jgi:DNA-binding CsgD family transcriptional regulator